MLIGLIRSSGAIGATNTGGLSGGAPDAISCELFGLNSAMMPAKLRHDASYRARIFEYRSFALSR
jgi:hypothetical protein